MNILRVFGKLVLKNLTSIIIFMVIAISMIIVRGTYISSTPTTFEKSSYNIAVIDNDDSDLSRELVSFLDGIHKIKDIGTDTERINENLYYRGIVAYIEIPEGFGETFMSDTPAQIDITIDDGMPLGTYVSNDIDSYLASVRSYMKLGYSIEESSGIASGILTDTEGINLPADDGSKADEKVVTVYEGMPYGIMAMILSGMIPVLGSFRRKLIADRTAVSSYSNIRFNLMIVTGTIMFAIVAAAITVLTATLVSGIDVASREWVLLSLNILACTVAITLMLPLVVNLCGSGASRSVAINVISLGFSFLGGVFIPLSIMSGSVKKFGSFLPTYWSSTAVSRITEGTASTASIFSCYGLQILFGLACLGVGLLISDMKLKRAG